MPTAMTAVLEKAPEKDKLPLCRFCGNPLLHTFVDLGVSPLCESYLSASDLDQGETFYPLHAFVCDKCFLVQLQEFEHPEAIFSDYAYFSSFSDAWLKHCEEYCRTMTERFGLNAASFVIEAASNDGYLLQYFVRDGVPVLGIEPAANVAKVAIEKGIPTLVRFLEPGLAQELASTGRCADLVIGNNVLAQVPNLNDFVESLKILLEPSGVLTLEFPHLLQLVRRNEFDTIYHEHFSYFSLFTTMQIMRAHGMRVFDVEELWTHGGSLRVYACREQNAELKEGPRVAKVLADEEAAGLHSIAGYEGFAQCVDEIKRSLLEFLLKAKREGKKVAGYGAPGKSATLLNYCGIDRSMLEYTVDRSPYKQGRFLPGTRIPIYHPDKIRQTKPDYIMILPWNLKDEIVSQLDYVRQWGGRFLVPIPKPEII